jgi:hypothetical protein
MSDLTIGLIAGGLVVFLLQWAGRHFLDRLVLPRVLDWWATQSRKMALNRAEFLLKTFESYLKMSSNFSAVILRAEERSHRLLAFPFGISFLMILAIFIRPYVPDNGTHDHIGLIVVGTITACALTIATVILENKRDYRALSDLAQYRNRVIGRLEKLYRAAGLDGTDIEERLERVPAAPYPYPEH